ncbi:DNA repair protein RecO [Rubrivivax gelatinosus]|uniref:DNA repair protein RecO n=1 Tax=Rubrivivax gelatinosus TaxID=28068 RepID=A0ABS1DVU4_RUBGE|nr:DNA repair protein RecO [Rubrivivax gelatinosus]MBK1612389.1 DNA repair protein RecO [Rubrivivax gelatinosus]MBK1713848.1 DNA repair protein RecO [Rubrivivax gelatinosus]
MSRAAAAPLAAYVLHSYDWSETSLIVELFTRERGRVVVAAKGAKRPTSQLRPVLLPFQRIAVQLGRTPADEAAEVHTLRSAEWGGGVPAVPAATMFSAFYCNELLLKLLARQDAYVALFDAYAQTLAALAADEGAALRAFELTLLRELGLLPELGSETLTLQSLQPTRRYALHPEAGLVADADGLPGADWVRIEAALLARHGGALRAACAPVAAALRGPLRAVLHYHLGHARLRSRQVFHDVQKLVDTTSR